MGQSFSTTPIANRGTDSIASIYQHVDFTNTVIAGSYALHQFTRPTTWTPNDVDIVGCYATQEAFAETVATFAAATKGTIVKMNDFSHGHPHDIETGLTGHRDEKFHESIRASAKVSVPGIPLEIQFVRVHATERPIEVLLEEITDLPSCVSYKVYHGKKMFLIPQKGITPLATHRVLAAEICPSRREKYEERGYYFD